MTFQTGRGWLLAAVLCACTAASAQTLGNQTLAGKYFFRYVSIGTDLNGNATDPRSMLGTITFDGNGQYTFLGQQVQGTNAAASASGSGKYSMGAAGVVSMDSPLRSGATVNARWGSDVLVGSATESSDNTFDMMVAIRAPSSAPNIVGSSYWVATLEFPAGNGRAARNAFFNLSATALNRIPPFTVIGHATNVAQGTPVTQQFGGATFSLAADGSGTVNFGAVSGSALLSGVKNLYVSADGNTILGGTDSQHDILIGVKAPTAGSNALFNGNYWAAGLRFKPSAQPPDVTSFAGAMVARGQGTFTWTKRIKALGFGAYDFTGANSYAVLSNSSGTADFWQIGMAQSGTAVVGAAIHPLDPNAYEIFLGVEMADLKGTGVFLNPQGVTSAASFFPPGAPIAPGEFIALFGTGLAGSAAAASPPYPPSLNGVSVLINGKPAPMQAVSATQINCLVPYATDGSTATIVVQNRSTNSNPVTVALAPTAPSVFTLNQSGTGLAAVLHADYTRVDSSMPAAPGETVLVFLTGMGAVSPSVADGTAGGSNPLSNVTAKPLYVMVGGEISTIAFSGLAPGFPGLYQMNVTLPPFIPQSGVVPLAIQTPNAFHDQVDIAIK